MFVPPGSGRHFLKIESTSVYLNIIPPHYVNIKLNIEYIYWIVGICKKCRYLIKEMESKDSSKPDPENIAEQLQELTLVRI